jgi:hypothetical protein
VWAHPWCMIPMYPPQNNFVGASVIDAILCTRTCVKICTCAHPFSTWHAIVSQLASHLARDSLTIFLILDMI